MTPNFPDGFTAFDGDGQWRNPQTGQIARDPTKVLIVAAKRIARTCRAASAVIDAYKARYRQQSVGIDHPRLLRRVLEPPEGRGPAAQPRILGATFTVDGLA